MRTARKNPPPRAAAAGILWSAVLAFATMAPAWAAFDDTTLRVAGRVLGFLEKPPSGNVQVAIVYAPDDSRSVADAQRLQAMLGSGIQIGNVFLQGRTLKIADADIANIGLILLAEGAGSSAGRVGEIARKRHLPCITTDLAQVRSGACAIGVGAQPRVQIIVNQAAANASAVRFSTAFRMLITEL